MERTITVDLNYLGRTGIISAHLAATGDGGFVLLDSGPASTLEALERGVAAVGLELDGLRAVLLTHIHLDHAAAAGALSRRTGCEVWAHPEGIQHLADPGARLLPSALRLYGSRLEALFGTMEPVPADRLHAVEHGATLRFGSLDVVGWHTPGHARHHVAWQVDDEIATGDVAGVRMAGSSHVRPPMPPPDIDLESWHASLALLRGLEPRRLLLTHFGGFDDAARHLDELEGRISRWTAIAEEVIREGGDAVVLGGRLAALDDQEMAAAGVPEAQRAMYGRLGPMVENSTGLFRYLKRQAQGSSPA
jgi:glyoxylase-like metal-dependent hydrolase (beta-lactamase superfamily II)